MFGRPIFGFKIALQLDPHELQAVLALMRGRVAKQLDDLDDDWIESPLDGAQLRLAGWRGGLSRRLLEVV